MWSTLAIRQTPGNNSTVSVLASQWINPSDVTTVLMIIGGDVIQKALAQTTGCWYTPVCFSFGWVAYSFMALVNVLGDGRLLPEPDVACKVINLKNGYSRENRNWVIGRLIRDNESHMSRVRPLDKEAMRISIWEALENPNKSTKHHYWSIHIWGVLFMALQLTLAAVPIRYGDWAILLVTGAGTILSITTGFLPQWTAEKLPNRQHSTFNYALTSGNGSRDIMIILGGGKCLNLEDLSLSETPRNGRPWEKFNIHEPPSSENRFLSRRTSSNLMATKLKGGMPTGFLVTYVVCIIQALLWLVLLITVSAISAHTWFLLGVGFIGMFQNALLAAMEFPTEHRNLPLKHKDTIVGKKKVMDALMDLYALHECGEHLVREFFPGNLEPAERDWWEGKTAAYDDLRTKERENRGPPRTENHMPNPKPISSKQRNVNTARIVPSKFVDPENSVARQRDSKVPSSLQGAVKDCRLSDIPTRSSDENVNSLPTNSPQMSQASCSPRLSRHTFTPDTRMPPWAVYEDSNLGSIADITIEVPQNPDWG